MLVIAFTIWPNPVLAKQSIPLQMQRMFRRGKYTISDGNSALVCSKYILTTMAETLQPCMQSQLILGYVGLILMPDDHLEPKRIN